MSRLPTIVEYDASDSTETKEYSNNIQLYVCETLQDIVNQYGDIHGKLNYTNPVVVQAIVQIFVDINIIPTADIWEYIATRGYPILSENIVYDFNQLLLQRITTVRRRLLEERLTVHCTEEDTDNIGCVSDDTYGASSDDEHISEDDMSFSE